MKQRTTVLGGLIAIALLVPTIFACTTLRKAQPILPIQDYERMLVGSLDADYVGQDACLAACHVHDQLAAYLERSVHGLQTNEGTGMPLFDCETCHGPGSLAVEHAKENQRCDSTQFIPIRQLPPGAQALMCLKCHDGMSMPHLQFWGTSNHFAAGVVCMDCHRLHQGREQKMRGKEIAELCSECHQEVETELAYWSRHPVKEGKMTCATCHEVHGTVGENDLKAADTEGLCFKCHGDKTGPFLFEHGGEAEGCATCHRPHGSPYANLLQYQEPFLCLQCHAGHVTAPGSPSSPGVTQAFFTNCSNCHSAIHGTDIQESTAGSRFIK